MTRREFISLAGGTAVAWPLVARAQEKTVPTPRIAYLGASSPAILDPRQIEQFKVGLRQLELSTDIWCLKNNWTARQAGDVRP